ncbi:Bifunctional oligoribonuclease and PAP phosphatase NrnA [Methanosarcinaceae archaeon Ag5]|uniref:Bifunctional oligoribonuclease and PAP phosphatase NrnA n=1 Tax=Methanolapillus africanus TaxID=3028297 RepID=A0AAE4MHN4_9EURY|nr:Bifunctional oligoribonuclease and PAP phosphatase NrnA [Methanosarcinaceae archaeon Ag5]
MRVTDTEFLGRLLDYRNILYVCHRNADPDAIGSAFTLAEAVGGTVGIVDDCNRVASNLVEKLDIPVVMCPDPKDYDLTVVLDTSTRGQLNDMKFENYCLIDHHATTALLDDAKFFIHEESTSTVEIIFRMLNRAGIPISEKMGLAMITGIITDTGHLKHANADTFKTLSDIMIQSNVDYFDALELMAATPQDVSIRIAMLKAAMRCKLERVDERLIATTYVSSYGGAAASMLTNIGADVAFVGSVKDDNSVRVSGRAKRDMIASGVNLGKMMEEIGEKYNGTGGGHSGAAGIDAECSLEEIMAYCTGCVKKVIENTTGTSCACQTIAMNDPDEIEES